MSSKLDQWLRNQPPAVRNGPTSSNANHFVFVLLMQFHITKVQLHHPFAFHRPRSVNQESTPAQRTMSSIAAHCQTLGSASAIKLAKLFATFRQRHDIRHLQCSGIQYAATGARFLVKYIPLLQPDEVVEPEAHLRSLIRTLEDMTQTFKPALKPLDEAKTALQVWETRNNTEPSARACSAAPRAGPVLDHRLNDMSPRSLFPKNDGELELGTSPNSEGETCLGYPSGQLCEEKAGLEFSLLKRAESRTFSLESRQTPAVRRSVDGWENLVS